MGIEQEKSLLTATIELRRQAEERFRVQMVDLPLPRSGEATLRLVHELEVHQIELEMQNEELHRAEAELESSHHRYIELYDFAPIGYFTFDGRGAIQQVNLAGAQLLGIERGLLVQSPFSSFIADADGRELFSQHLAAVLHQPEMLRCAIRLRSKEGREIYGQLQSVRLETSENQVTSILSAIVDGTVAKQLEKELQRAHDELKEKNGELERLNRFFVGREIKMVELKEQIRELKRLNMNNETSDQADG